MSSRDRRGPGPALGPAPAGRSALPAKPAPSFRPAPPPPRPAPAPAPVPSAPRELGWLPDCVYTGDKFESGMAFFADAHGRIARFSREEKDLAMARRLP